MKSKKSVMDQIVTVFVMILVVSILAGLTFLFVANLKTQTQKQAPFTTISIINESMTKPTATGTYLSPYPDWKNRDLTCGTISVYNDTGDAVIPVGNYTQTGTGNCLITNNTKTRPEWSGPWLITYDYTYKPWTSADKAVNGTETSGYITVGYLPLIFLALIFGAILGLILKIILPFLNMSQVLGDGF